MSTSFNFKLHYNKTFTAHLLRDQATPLSPSIESVKKNLYKFLCWQVKCLPGN